MNLVTYEQYKETKRHGTASFAYNTYLCTIPQDFARVPPHWHDEMEIIIIRKGEGIVQVELQSYNVKAGDIVFVAPGALHGIDGLENVRMEYENIIFSLSILDAKDDWCRNMVFAPMQSGALQLPIVLRPDMQDYTEAMACIERADAVCAAKPDGYPLLVKAQLFALLYTLYKYSHNVQPRLLAKTTPEASARMKQALHYVEENYAQLITVDDMAKLCCCSQSHFMRFFKEAAGVSFVQYLNDYRLGMAARAITETDCTIIEAAQNAGFDNVSYFNRLFKKKYNVTPRFYRKKG